MKWKPVTSPQRWSLSGSVAGGSSFLACLILQQRSWFLKIIIKKSPFSTSASQHSWPIPDNNFQKGCGLLSLECLNMPLYEGMVGKFLQSGSILDTHRTYNLARGFIFLSLKWGGIPVVYAFTRSKGMNLLGSNQRGIIDYKIERNQ